MRVWLVSVFCMYLLMVLKQQKAKPKNDSQHHATNVCCNFLVYITFKCLSWCLSVFACWLIWESIYPNLVTCVCLNMVSSSLYVELLLLNTQTHTHFRCLHPQKQFPLILPGTVPPARTTPARLLRQERSSKPARRKPRCLRQQQRVKGTGERWDSSAPSYTHIHQVDWQLLCVNVFEVHFNNRPEGSSLVSRRSKAM